MKKSKSIFTTFTAMILAGTLAAQGNVSAKSLISIEPESKEAIYPFRAQVPKKDLKELRKQILETRWPDKEIVSDQSQGVQLATMRKLADYWATKYDWRRAESKLNALPQFKTTIDGIEIHFIHVRSKEPNALPVIITHGWPGSIFEELKLIGPLTNPTAYGGKPEDAFDVVIPSIPGYGFSGKPNSTGWNSMRIARAWDTLMKRLGYNRYVSQGGDWGSRISESLGHLAPSGLLGIHMNLLNTVPPEVSKAVLAGEPEQAAWSEKEKLAYNQRKALNPIGYFAIQARRPQTIGFSLAESPIGLAAWLLDHDPHSYQQLADAIDGKPDGELTQDEILDNITLYWLTNTGTSAARLYWEEVRLPLKGEVFVPTAFTVFPGEIFRAPRSWVEHKFRNLIYFNEVEKGGHFAAWEQPQLFAEEMRAAFKSLRNGPVAKQSATKRVELQRHDLSFDGREVSQALVTVGPEETFPRHNHPGEEVIYVLEGVFEYQLDGKPPVRLKAGETLFIPAGTIHSAKNVGTGNAVELATHIVDKKQPLLTIVK